jgi:glutaminyl-peptide cyclotransferase
MVQVVRGIASLAAIVGATGAQAAPTSNAIAPPHEARLAPASSTFAPAGRAIAPSSVSLAPTSEAQIARASGPPGFDAARAWAHLQKQVSFGPRPSGSAALKQCRDYIIAELKKVGLDAREQAFVARTPAGDIPMINLVATIPGRRAERVILASHYDTKRSPNFRFVGASDAASSTAALLELGRVLKARQNEFTMELLFLDGEEAVNWEWRDPDNTYGSRYYVDAARKSNTLGGIKALVLLDMIGDRDLMIRRDASSTPWLVDTVWDAAGRLGHRNTFSNELTAIEDDHAPFMAAGVPSVDIIDLDYPQWHTAQDDLQHVSEKSLKIVGDVVVAALPDIERRLGR